jgi:hypothetical protein
VHLPSLCPRRLQPRIRQLSNAAPAAAIRASPSIFRVRIFP